MQRSYGGAGFREENLERDRDQHSIPGLCWDGHESSDTQHYEASVVLCGGCVYRGGRLVNFDSAVRIAWSI